MSFNRIKAILLQEFFNVRKSVDILFDVLLFPLVNIILFAFLSIYIAQSVDPIVIKQLLLGSLLWQFMYLVQYSVSVGTMWNLWSRNLTNIFITPIKMSEYFTAFALSGIVKSLSVFLFAGVWLLILFDFDVFAIGWIPLLIYMILLWIFGIGMGIVVIGLIFRYGTRISAVSWGFLPLLQPLMATVFPRSILPEPLRSIALLFPPTYVFEAARSTLANGLIPWDMVFIALIGDGFYLFLSALLFQHLYTVSKMTGQFVRNE